MKWENNGTYFEFTINEYDKLKVWCEVTLKVENKYFNYYNKDEILERNDVNKILDSINRLLNRKMIKPEVLHFTEPDLSFAFYPPRLQREVGQWIPIENIDSLTELYTDMIIDLCLNEAFCGQYYIVELYEDELIEMREYLIEVTK